MASAGVVGCDSAEPLEGEEGLDSDELEALGDGTSCDAGKPTTPDAGKPDAGKPTTPKPDGGTTPGNPGGGNNALWCEAKTILDKSCTGCHDGQGTAGTPMGLKTFAETKAYAAQVSARVHDSARPMPPRGLLPAADLAKIDAWVKAGSPGSDSADCSGGTHPGGEHPGGETPPTGGFDESECDAVYELRAHGPGGKDVPYSVPVGAEIHPQISVPAPWGNETVQVIGWKPLTDNQKVLHHWILYGPGRAFLTGWAPGDEVRPPYPDDVGMEVGRNLTLDMHYYNKGGSKPELDRSGVAVCVLKRGNFRPKSAAVTMGLMSIGSGGVLAPRGAVNKPTTGTCNVTTTQPVHLMTAAPHAHKYATHMKFVVKKKNGKEIVMHDQPFKFGEQGTYALEGGEVIVETGDVITTTCSYTNPTNKDIRFGESTESEMCFNFAAYWPKGALRCSGGLGGLFGR